MIKIGVESPIQLALVSQEVVDLEILVQPPMELILAHDDVTKGDPGDSAYQIAVKNGFIGTQQQWLDSLEGADGLDGTDGREIELQSDSEFVQWRYVGESIWIDLVALSSLKGVDGKSIELQNTGTYIQWRLVGNLDWINLIAIADLEGPDGKSAYQSYLDTTTDNPPLSESEWANLFGSKVSEAPTDNVDYVRQNGTWVPLPERIGAGFESNVYLSNTDSGIAGYKKLLYDADTAETIKTIVANNNTVQGEKYLYDFAIETISINPGIYKFAFYGDISSITGGTTTLNARVFLYTTGGVENNLFTATKILTNTVNDSIDFTYNVTSVITCNSTDRLGIQLSLTTTRNSNTTFTYYLGDEHPAYFVTTLPYRHQLLRDLLWLLSGHKGTANFIAMFDEFGNAKESNQINVKNATFLTEYDNGDSGPAKTIDWNNGQNQKITLTANCVLTLPSVTGTGRFQMKVIQDGTGARSLSFTSASVKNPTNFDFASGTANQECIITFYWDGAKYIILSTPYYN